MGQKYNKLLFKKEMENLEKSVNLRDKSKNQADG